MPDRYVTCPKCQTQIPVANKVGRKPLGIPVNIVYDALRDCRGITQTAQKLGCSRGYIYKVLAREGLNLKEVLEK